MRSFYLNPLPSLLLIVLLGIIAVVLIVPEVDLPDTAFHRNSSPLAIRASSHQVSQSYSNAGQFRFSFAPEDTTLPRRVREIYALSPEPLPSQHINLRC